MNNTTKKNTSSNGAELQNESGDDNSESQNELNPELDNIEHVISALLNDRRGTSGFIDETPARVVEQEMQRVLNNPAFFDWDEKLIHTNSDVLLLGMLLVREANNMDTHTAALSGDVKDLTGVRLNNSVIYKDINTFKSREFLSTIETATSKQLVIEDESKCVNKIEQEMTQHLIMALVLSRFASMYDEYENVDEEELSDVDLKTEYSNLTHTKN